MDGLLNLIKMDDLGVPLFSETPIYTSTFQFGANPKPRVFETQTAESSFLSLKTHDFPPLNSKQPKGIPKRNGLFLQGNLK